MNGLSQRFFETVQASADVRFAHAEDIADFAVRVAFQVQQQKGAVRIALLLQKVSQLAQLLSLCRVVSHHGWNSRPIIVETRGLPSPSSLPPPKVDGHVERHSKHPRRELATAVVLPKRSPQPPYDFLQQVITIVRRSTVRPADLE